MCPGRWRHAPAVGASPALVDAAWGRSRTAGCFAHYPAGFAGLGELGSSVATALEVAVAKAQEHADGALVLLDFAELELLSPRAARVLIAAETRYRSRQGRVVVQHVPARIDAALRAEGLEDAFEVLDAGCSPDAAALPAVDSVLPQGEMSLSTVLTLERAVRTITDHGRRPVIVDLRDVTVPVVAVAGAPLELALTLGLDADGAGALPPDR